MYGEDLTLKVKALQMIRCVDGLLFSLILLTSLHRFYSKSLSTHLFRENFLQSIVPVFHNVQTRHVPLLASLVRNRPYCSLSLRHPEAIPSLEALTHHMASQHSESKCHIGASTVISVDQAALSLQSGAEFISTKDFLPEVLQYCISTHTAILFAVKNMKESVQAIELGANALKLYPSAQMYEDTFQEIAKLRKESSTRISIVASGGINNDNLRRFKKYGATHFAIGYDLNTMSCAEIEQDLVLCDEILQREH